MAWAILMAYALAQIGLLIVLFANHAPAPFNLEAMESTILEHVRRLMAGQFVYADPSSQFAALAYTPLYYVVSVPFVWLFGSNLLALRLSAMLAAVGSGALIFMIVRRHTNSRSWALIAVGLFAAAYRVMDTYLDTAHSDAWLLFSTLLGCHLIDQNRSPRRDAVGVAVLVAAFWFKQHGAVFVAGALAYLTWRHGWRRSWIYWAIAGVLGPGLYAIAPAWFGPRFHYFTWQVPRQWMSFNRYTVERLLEYFARAYPVLTLLGVGGMVAAVARRQLTLWYAMLPFALLAAVLGAMDDGSNNNVFIPAGVWLVLTGVLALQQLIGEVAWAKRWNVHLAALAISWAALAYDPRPLLVPAQAYAANRDLVTYVRSLDGPVYAPGIGTLPTDNPFSPTLQWVPLEDMVRGPNVDEDNHPLSRRLLRPVLHPTGPAYVLVDSPLSEDDLLGFLSRSYVLKADLGDRFATLAGLPRRFTTGGPRYLYRYRAKTGTSAP